MNQDQWLTLLRQGLTALCSILVTKGVISAADAPLYVTALMTVLPGVILAGIAWWNNHNHSDAAKVAAIATMPQAQAAQAVASLPPASRDAVALAAVPDKAIVAAVNAMPDVTSIQVKPTASDGVGQALADPALAKVVAAEVKP